MTRVEVTAFTIAWFALLSLAGLVLLLYRQVEKAYRHGTAAGDSTLPIGAHAPEVFVVHDGAIQALEMPSREPVLLAFVTTSCDSCASLMRHLEERASITTYALVTGDGLRAYAEQRNPRLHVRWVASPADIHEQYAVSVVPTLYVVRDGRVRAAGTDGSEEGIGQLLADASEDQHAGIVDRGRSAPLPIVRSDGA